MIDGPASFLIVFGLLGAAIIGAVLFLVCVVMVCHPRHRHRVLRSWRFGAVGAGIGFVATSLLSLAVIALSDGMETTPSLFLTWFTVFVFAGFAAGVTLDVILRRLARRAGEF